jgi:hypothetical protein
MNNSRESASRNCSKDSIKEFLFNYLEPSLNVFGIIANGFCVIVFFKILTRRQSLQGIVSGGNIFKYLFLKSIMDFLNFVSNFFETFYDCHNCESSKSFVAKLWFIWIYNYFQYIVQTSSSVFEIAATFDCYITIIKKFTFFQTNLFFYSFSSLVVIVCTLVYIIFPFNFTIKKVSNHTYEYDYSKFGKTSLSNSLYMADSFIRDGFFLVVLIFLNALILSLLIKTTKRRRDLVRNNMNNSSLLTIAQKAERKRMIMITLTGLNYMIGHSLFFVYNILPNKDERDMGYCLFRYLYFFYIVSYANSIIFYYFFNSIFKRYLIGLIPFIQFFNNNSNRRNRVENISANHSSTHF